MLIKKIKGAFNRKYFQIKNKKEKIKKKEKKASENSFDWINQNYCSFAIVALSINLFYIYKIKLDQIKIYHPWFAIEMLQKML